MLSKFHRQAIITGYIDSYCLVCESHLRTEDDMNTHIAKPIHTKNLNATSYLDKYKDECIRKVKKGYYCEFCNLLLSTAAKVGLHASEDKHTNNKGMQLLKRSGNSVIAFQDIVIDEKAWHGLLDNTCALCNTEFDNGDIHKTEQSHILNLVQNKVEFGADRNIFRNIDERSFQCLTCNLVLGMNTITTHFDESKHKELYQKCRQNDINLNTNETKETENNEAPKVNNVEEKHVQQKAEVEKSIKQTPPEKPESSTKTVNKTDTPVTNVKKQENPSPKQTTQTEPKVASATEKKKTVKLPYSKISKDIDEDICKALDAKDYIIKDEHDLTLCLICDWNMDPKIVSYHVEGRHHRKMLKMHKERMQTNNNSDSEIASVSVKKKESSAEDEGKDKILDSLSKFQNNGINVNFLTNSALCRKCSKDIDFNFVSIEEHIEEHNKKAPPKKEAVKTEASAKPEQVVKPTPVVTENKADDPKKVEQPAKRNDEAGAKPVPIVKLTPVLTENKADDSKKVQQSSKRDDEAGAKSAPIVKSTSVVTENKTNDPKKVQQPAKCDKEPGAKSAPIVNPTLVLTENKTDDPKKAQQPAKRHEEASAKPAPMVNPTPVLTKNKANNSKNVKQPAKQNRPEKVETRASSVASNGEKENEEEIIKFAKDHNLGYIRNSNSVYCRVCDSLVPSSVNSMKEHVAGTSHKNKAAKGSEHKQTKIVTIKTPMENFVKNIVVVESNMMKDVILNERYCINFHSFQMITCMDQLRCEICEVNLTTDQLDEHKVTSRHERGMCDTVVISSMDSEFIRELRPGVLHCGFCNIVISKEDLDTHFASTAHREGKTSANWRLQQYLPDFQQEMQQDTFEMLLVLRTLNEGRDF